VGPKPTNVKTFSKMSGGIIDQTRMRYLWVKI
jgi:hypothetical protein